MKEIGAGLHLKLSNLTNLIDRLEEGKLVRRTNSKTDRRAVVVELTAKGEKSLEKYNAMFEELAGQVAAQVPAEQLAAAAACLDVLSTAQIDFSAD